MRRLRTIRYRRCLQVDPSLPFYYDNEDGRDWIHLYYWHPRYQNSLMEMKWREIEKKELPGGMRDQGVNFNNRHILSA